MSNTLTKSLPAGRLPGFAFTWLPVLLGLLALYFHTYWDLARYTWTQDNHAHGPMILAMALYLTWKRREVFASSPSVHPNLAGWPLVLLGLLLFALGRSQEVILLAVSAQIPLFAGILLLTRGTAALRALWFPLLFLVFMIPLPGFLVDGATGALKLQVSQVAEQALYMLDYPVARNGVTISIGPYQLLVADACSGLYSMFSLTAVGLLYVYLMQRQSRIRNGILLASIVPIAFAANCVRVVALAAITYHQGEAAGQGLTHDLSSPMLFTLAILFIAGLDALLGGVLPDAKPGQEAVAKPVEGNLRQTVPLAKVRYLTLTLTLLAGIGLAFALTPTVKMAEIGTKVELESMIPKQFGEWTVDEKVAPLRTDPATAALLDQLYNQILSRTYVDRLGRRVMLLIAYGGDQSESMQVHKPEVCYPSLGFRLYNENAGSLDTGLGRIPVRRMVAVQGQRIEPVTYWMTIGDKIAEGGGGAWKLEQIKYGLTGKIPDGLLFRLSSITSNDKAAFEAQQTFTQDLIKALPAKDCARFIGQTTPKI
jgi:exosortase B